MYGALFRIFSRLARASPFGLIRLRKALSTPKLLADHALLHLLGGRRNAPVLQWNVHWRRQFPLLTHWRKQ